VEYQFFTKIFLISSDILFISCSIFKAHIRFQLALSIKKFSFNFAISHLILVHFSVFLSEVNNHANTFFSPHFNNSLINSFSYTHLKSKLSKTHADIELPFFAIVILYKK
jgi:hypothetical protein